MNTMESKRNAPHTQMRGTRAPIPYVCIVSGDGMEFVLPEAAARQSKMISSLLDAVYGLPNRGGFGDQHQANVPQGVYASNKIDVMPRIPLQPITGRTLQLVCSYFMQRSTGDINSTEEFLLLSELNPASDEDQDTVAELLLAADFLDC
ncbi:hypothetical protein DQ04_03231030 [Trypanosoma grayi]|uniref:hypothetical protein n=1 Tax=Trypanosoma grayi TaxID=71804 RepID=UPI0004F42315|nr:hypothetical protein DQ04_03231030 [Trypanosoma grayi]KEG10843.1 hypothetical protein DQ04_03231030 [Trypanosoma grayi]